LFLQLIPTIHLGSFTNNYFTETITTEIDVFAESAGVVI
jgi:hypothetical protein